jgi:putative inorganic carbon (HCO3(-)) transporter
VGVWQFGLRGEGPNHFAILGGDFYRAYGTFEQPNPYAGYLGITLPLALGPLMATVYGRVVNWYHSRSGRGRSDSRSAGLPAWQFLFLGGVAGVMLAGLGMSWSRGAWLGFGAAAAAMALALPQDARWGVLLVGLLAVGGLGLYVTGLLPPSVAARLTDFAQYVRFEDVRGVGINDANYAVLERLAHWQAGLEMLRHNLWTGVGLGCYEPAYGDFALINWPIALGHAHNTYLNMAAETGLTGLCAYLFLWGVVFWQTWQVTRRAGGPWRGVAIGLLGTWTHLTVHNFLDNLYVNNVHLHIGAMLGVLAFVIRQTERQVEGQDLKR